MIKTESQHSRTHIQNTAQRKSSAASRPAQGGQTAQLEAMINASPYVTAQRKKFESLFGGAAQLEAAPVQRAVDEEPLQGKFDAVQRAGEEELLQGKFAAVQRVEDEEPLQGKFDPAQRVEEEEPLQGKFTRQTSAQLKEEPAAKPNNTGLPDNLKNGIESLSGLSMDNVRVHYNSSQPAQLNALAYAQGTDIHVAPGQEHHLPHEAWHIVQQAQGRVQPTMQMKGGVPVNDDKGLEHEADVMGGKALQKSDNPSAGAFSPAETPSHSTGCGCPGCRQAKSIVQRQPRMVIQPKHIENIQKAADSGSTATVVHSSALNDAESGGPVAQMITAWVNKSGRKKMERFDDSGNLHAEQMLLAKYTSGNIEIEMDAWPCINEGRHNCHQLLINSSAGRIITLTITADSSGYALGHGKKAGSTGTITYDNGAATYS